MVLYVLIMPRTRFRVNPCSQSIVTGKQRVKVANAYSSWKEIFYRIPQGSILGPLIFNIFLCDLFYFLEGVAVASYADDTTPYSADKTNDLVINKIEHFSEVLLNGLILTT